jgi:hypothetical protein
MFFQNAEHNPPHFHAVYGEFMGAINIQTLELIEGDLPHRALALVREWAKKNQTALLDMWNSQNLYELPPLD